MQKLDDGHSFMKSHLCQSQAMQCGTSCGSTATWNLGGMDSKVLDMVLSTHSPCSSLYQGTIMGGPTPCLTSVYIPCRSFVCHDWARDNSNCLYFPVSCVIAGTCPCDEACFVLLMEGGGGGGVVVVGSGEGQAALVLTIT